MSKNISDCALFVVFMYIKTTKSAQSEIFLDNLIFLTLYICSYYTDKFSVKLHVEQKPINSDLQIHWFSIHCGHIWVLHTK